jgi:hypothetical protein
MNEKLEYTKSDMEAAIEAAVAQSRMRAMMMLGDYVRTACVAERRACAEMVDRAGHHELAHAIRIRMFEDWQ